MGRDTRYQGAILRGDKILLIKHTEHEGGRSYWLLPGGGIETGETEEDCVVREMLEETSLKVKVRRLLIDEAGLPRGIYQRMKTYLCDSPGGEPRPGYEPEPAAAAEYGISAVGWYDLRHPEDWGEQIVTDPITYPMLMRIRSALGYGVQAP
jgi:8-oxo-dGTP pyrophosphatase MutT (NUDIX family)